MKKLASNLLIIITSILITLLLAEIGLRVAGKFDPPVVRSRRPDLYQFDEQVGYRLWRSTRTCDRYPVDSPEVLSIISNADGFRNTREFDATRSGTGILVLGDSFVFGNGVEVEDRFTEVLETLQPEWRVDNLGMTGWGMDLMIRALEQFAARIQPDIVVLAVYTDDFRRLTPYYAGVGYPIPKYRLSQGELVTVRYPAPDFWQRMRVYQAMHQSYWQSTLFRDRYDLNGKLLDRFLELSEQHQFAPVVMFLPGKSDTDHDRQRRGFLADWTTHHQIPYLDLTEAIHSAGVDKTYIKGNFHWNANGHRIAGQQLYELLRVHFPE